MYFAYLCKSKKEYCELFHELEECGFDIDGCGKSVNKTEDDTFRLLCGRTTYDKYPFAINNYTQGIPVLIGGYSNFLERVVVSSVQQTLDFSHQDPWYNISKFDKSQYIWTSTPKDFLEKIFSVRHNNYNSYRKFCDIKNGKDRDYFKNVSLSHYPIFRLNSSNDYENVKSKLKEHGFVFDYSDEELNKLLPNKRYFISNHLFDFYSMKIINNDQLYRLQRFKDMSKIIPVDNIDYYTHSMLLQKKTHKYAMNLKYQ